MHFWIETDEGYEEFIAPSTHENAARDENLDALYDSTTGSTELGFITISQYEVNQIRQELYRDYARNYLTSEERQKILDEARSWTRTRSSR